MPAPITMPTVIIMASKTLSAGEGASVAAVCVEAGRSARSESSAAFTGYSRLPM